MYSGWPYTPLINSLGQNYSQILLLWQPCVTFKAYYLLERQIFFFLSAMWRWVFFLQLVLEDSSADCTVIRGDWGSL